jgi:hypothetical protein
VLTGGVSEVNQMKNLESTIASTGGNAKKTPEDDARTPNIEPLEECTYIGPKYPDDSNSPNRVVYRSKYDKWMYEGYRGPKYPD